MLCFHMVIISNNDLNLHVVQKMVVEFLQHFVQIFFTSFINMVNNTNIPIL
jgi:hypothetical protein